MIPALRDIVGAHRPTYEFCLIVYLSVGAFCLAGVAIVQFAPPAGVSAAPPSAASIPHDRIVETDPVATPKAS